MANWFSRHHFLLLLWAITVLHHSITTAASSSAVRITVPPPSPSRRAAAASPPPRVRPPSGSTTPAVPPPTPQRWSEVQEQQLESIIDALTEAGDFRSWAGLLSASAPSNLPISATFFIPGDDALSHLPTPNPTSTGNTTNPSMVLGFDPFLIPYHIIPQRLAFSDLQLFEIRTRLPTLLPGNSIVITNNSQSNFTVDGALVTIPDLYADSSVCVHGVKMILDYAVYGVSPDPPVTWRPTPEIEATPDFPTGEATSSSGAGSDAEEYCLCIQIPVIFWVLWVAFAFKIYGNPLSR